jgi:endoglucanase
MSPYATLLRKFTSGLLLASFSLLSLPKPTMAQTPNTSLVGRGSPDPAPNSSCLHTSGAQILDASGQPASLSGVNWFGFETANFAPHGLWSRNYTGFLDDIQRNGYNVIRLPFANAMLRDGAASSGIDYNLNPELAGLTPLELMDKIIEGANQRGLKIILDNHRSTAGGGPESNGLWYTADYPESTWIDDWKMLAARYPCGSGVIGADLRNEPHDSACWGCGDESRDWRLAAEKAGNAVLAVNPDLLILVEGVGEFQGNYTWWGGNLMGAAQYPVRLSLPDRLVYSPHDYPASIYPQTWFGAADYPANLPAVWDKYWGYIQKQGIAPVLIGEFGTRLQTDSDKQWISAMQSYIQGNKLSWTFWSLNPDSGDTGGLLQDDWSTWDLAKQAILQPIQYPPLGTLPAGDIDPSITRGTISSSPWSSDPHMEGEQSIHPDRLGSAHRT